MKAILYTKERVPYSFWESLENRKKFLDDLALKLNIKQASDWGKIPFFQFSNFGGEYLLHRFYNGSPFACLKSIYKEWFSNVKYFPKSYWKSMENRKKLLDELSIHLQIKKPSDWGKLRYSELPESLRAGLSSLLSLYYNNSLFSCLKSIYKGYIFFRTIQFHLDIEWNREWFSKLPKMHWESLENRRKFLDKAALTLKIKSPKDWGKIPFSQLRELRGSSLLGLYNNSPFACLKSVYRDIDWKEEWFINRPRFPRSHWNSLENCIKFVNEVAANSNVQEKLDWRKITPTLIRNQGGTGLLRKYEGSLRLMIQNLFPLEWIPIGNKRTSTEIRLEGLVSAILPNENIFSNHRSCK